MGVSATTVREATAQDLTVMQRLLEELGYLTDVETLSARFSAFAKRGESALLAERDGEILGLATLHITPVLHRAGAVGRVTALVVTEAARGSGAGSALMREAEARLKAAGCVLMEVTSNKKRTDAHTFYERLGYEATSLRFGKPLT